MKRPKLKGCDMDTLERIVRDNAKQRFSMRAEPTSDDGRDEWWIRANQGHSIKVRRAREEEGTSRTLMIAGFLSENRSSSSS